MRFLFFCLLASSAWAQKRIAITIDDLPYVSRNSNLADAQTATRKILDALRANNVPAIGFVNENKLQRKGEIDARVRLLEQWLDAGMTLGNHTFSHQDLNTKPLEWFQDDVIRGELFWRPLMDARGHKRLYFRHPFTHTGADAEKRAAFEKFLASRGYTIAPFTVEHMDYWFNSIYERLLEQGRTAEAERVFSAYLSHLDTALGYFETLARKYFNREIAQILLIHTNRLNSRALPEMLEKMRARGYGFVSLDDALADPAFRTEDRYHGTAGPSWVHRWSIALNHPMDLRNEPDPPKWLFDLHKQLEAAEKSGQ